jgi:hypothetical protein
LKRWKAGTGCREKEQLLKHTLVSAPKRPIVFNASGKVDELVVSTRQQAIAAHLDIYRVFAARCGILHTR